MKSKITLTNKVIVSLRLSNQQITGTKFKKPADVVRWMGAVQAQDYAASKWAVALRLPGSTNNDIEKAIADKTIVRTWPMRGTIHFVAPEDVRWIIDLAGSRIISYTKSRFEQLGLNIKNLNKCNTLLEKILSGGKQLTRDELRSEFKKARINADGISLSHIMLKAAIDKLICYGARRGKQFTYTLLDEWVPPGKNIQGDEALAELAKRYFYSRGPASIQDFAWWSGLLLTDVRAAIELIKENLTCENIDGQNYWFAREAKTNKNDFPEAVFLPAFDEYLVGYKDRSAVLESVHTRLINNGGGILSPSLIINGKVAASWQRTLKKDMAIIKINPFIKLTGSQMKLAKLAADKYGKFLELNVEIIS